ncbi:MAG: matrixin family metalloprotease, partial [Proteobacteria bacterium]|nr:matrixin family metalloprotease [Pseudomonadota bacterium]
MSTPTSSSPISTVPLSNNLTTDALLSGVKWGSDGVGTAVNISYSFPTASAVWDSSYDGYEPDWAGYRGLTATEQTAFKTALASFSAVANITFTQVSDTASSVGDIRVAFSGEVGDEGALAWAYYPSTDPWGGDIWLDPYSDISGYLGAGDFGMETIIHELGHALGLKHSFELGDSGQPIMPTQYDATFYTIMSYTESSPYYDWGNPSTPMVYDILALQYMYGANMTYHTGNDTYYLKDDGNTFAIWDAGGVDTIDASQLHAGIGIDLNNGATTLYGDSQAIGIAFGANIENFKGSSYADTVIGNELNNTFWLGTNDVYYGSLGNDTYIFTGTLLSSVAATDDGLDVIQTSGNINLGGNYTSSVEAFYLTGTAASTFFGSLSDDVAYGNASANRLAGAGGADTLSGGKGDDYYVIDDADTIVENAGEGTDTVEVGFDGPYTLGTNFENLVVGMGIGGSVAGNAYNNTLTGNGWDNRLDGGGGNDRLVGDKGSDTYVVDSIGDVIVESYANNVGGGTDTVESSISWSLAALTNVDNLTLTGSANINGTGNALANAITGN